MSRSSGLSSTINIPISFMLFLFSQCKPKNSSPAFLALGPDESSLALNYTMHNGEPHSRAFKILGAMQPLEHAEQFVGIFHIEACTIVPHKKDIEVVLLFAADLHKCRFFFT